jgi:hypothetical protein
MCATVSNTIDLRADVEDPLLQMQGDVLEFDCLPPNFPKHGLTNDQQHPKPLPLSPNFEQSRIGEVHSHDKVYRQKQRLGFSLQMGANFLCRCRDEDITVGVLFFDGVVDPRHAVALLDFP